MKKVKLLLLLSLFAFGFYLLWPQPPLAKQLEQLLDQVCQQSSVESPLPIIESQLRASKLSKMFGPNFSIHYRAPDFEFEREVSQREITEALVGGFMRLQELRSGVSRFKLVRSDSKEAVVSLFLVAEWREPGEAEVFKGAEDVEVRFQKIDGNWLIVGAETFLRDVT